MASETAIVFDLDGTLVHSVPDLHAAATKTLADVGKPPLPIDTIQSFVGNGVPKLVERVIQASDLNMADHENLTAAYLEHYGAAPSELSTLYPGVKDTLGALQAAGHPLALCTNKPQAPALLLMQDFDLAQFFDVVVGGDALDVRKPDPRHLLHTFEQLGARTGLYVGDSETDDLTAKNAQIPFAFFTQGYRKAAKSAFTFEIAFGDFKDFTSWVLEQD